MTPLRPSTNPSPRGGESRLRSVLTGHRVVLSGGRGWTYHLAVGGPIAWPLTVMCVPSYVAASQQRG
jgi:hypothetical protein